MGIKEIKKEFKDELRRLRREKNAAIREYKADYQDAKDNIEHRYETELEAYYRENGLNPPENPPKRAVLEEIGNAITHGLGALFAIFAFVMMLISSSEPLEYVSASIYFFGMFVMFSMSCLYHAFAHGSAVKRLFRRFDYNGIYLLIGATFAPVLLCTVGGIFGWVFFIVQWAIIITGIVFISVFGAGKLRALHMSLYITLGWSALILLPMIIGEHFELSMWVLGGGVAYSLGLIPFSMKSKAAHFIWHFFVLAGAIIQWIGIYLYVFAK